VVVVGGYIKRYAIIIQQAKTKEKLMSPCREAISFELLPTSKSIQRIWDTDRHNLLQLSKLFFLFCLAEGTKPTRTGNRNKKLKPSSVT
jgi:hypothetical protein